MTQEFKNKTVTITVASLISLVLGIWSIGMFYAGIEKRIVILEQKQERKAEKEDLRIIEVKLGSIEATLLELKNELKK